MANYETIKQYFETFGKYRGNNEINNFFRLQFDLDKSSLKEMPKVDVVGSIWDLGYTGLDLEQPKKDLARLIKHSTGKTVDTNKTTVGHMIVTLTDYYDNKGTLDALESLKDKVAHDPRELERYNRLWRKFKGYERQSFRKMLRIPKLTASTSTAAANIILPKNIPKKSFNFKKAGLIAGGITLTALLIYVLNKYRKNRKLYKYQKEQCLNKPNQALCMKIAKKQYLQRNLIDVKIQMSKCGQTRNPDKCKRGLQREIDNINNQIN